MTEKLDKVGIIHKNITNKAKQIFGDRFTAAILYGSYARGDYHENSDVDMMVLADIDKVELLQYRRVFDDLDNDIFWKFDLMSMTLLTDTKTFKKWEKHLPFYANIVKEGIWNYGR